jgi:hypothetical protein
MRDFFVLQRCTSSKSFRRLLRILLSLVVIYQIYFVIANYGKLWGSRILRTYKLTSMERSSLFVLGGDGANFIDFIKSVVPPDGVVIIPPGMVEFSSQNLMQFFLMPRSIPSCQCEINPEEYSDYCIQCLQKSNHYVPAIGNFPDEEIMRGWKQFIPYEQDTGWYHGIYAPLNRSSSSQDLPQSEEVPRTIAFIIDLLIYCALFLLGILIAVIVHRPIEWFRAFIIGIPIGTGILTWSVFFIALLGGPITSTTFFLVYLFLLLTTGILLLLTKGQEKVIILPKLNFNHLIRLLTTRTILSGIWIIIVIMLFLGVVISIGRGYSLYDGIANWALKGYSIALEGTIYAGREWGGHSLSYPQNVHLSIAIFKLADDDILPGSKLLFPIFSASLLLGFYSFLRRHQEDIYIPPLCVLLLLTVPVIFLHTTIGWGNIVFTTYIVLGSLYLYEGLLESRSDILFLGGVLMALASWTRPEGIAFAISIIISLLFMKRFRLKFIHLSLSWLIPLVIIPAVWLIFSSSSISRDEIGKVVTVFVQEVLEGKLNLQQLYALIKFSPINFFTIKTWGLIFHLMIILLIIGILSAKKLVKHNALPLLAPTMVALIFPLLMFFVASFSKENFDLFLSVSFDRALIPFSVLALTFVIIINSLDSPLSN